MVNSWYEQHSVHSRLSPSGQPYSVIDSQASTAASLRIAPMNRDVTHLRNSGRALWLIHRTQGLNQPEESGKQGHNSAAMSPSAYICGIHREVSKEVKRIKEKLLYKVHRREMSLLYTWLNQNFLFTLAAIKTLRMCGLIMILILCNRVFYDQKTSSWRESHANHSLNEKWKLPEAQP